MPTFRTPTLALSLAVAACFVGTAARAQTRDERAEWREGWKAYRALVKIPLADRGYVSAAQDLSIVIDAPIGTVFDIYANVFNALGLHPFLVGVTPVAFSTRRLDFIAAENIPLPDGTVFESRTIGRQRFHPRQYSYEVDTYTAPGVITHQRITFTRLSSSSTQVVEHLVFEAPPELIEFAVQGGVYAHLLVQLGLKPLIESGALKPVPFPRYLKNRCDEDEDDGED